MNECQYCSIITVNTVPLHGCSFLYFSFLLVSIHKSISCECIYECLKRECVNEWSVWREWERRETKKKEWKNNERIVKQKKKRNDIAPSFSLLVKERRRGRMRNSGDTGDEDKSHKWHRTHLWMNIFMQNWIINEREITEHEEMND